MSDDPIKLLVTKTDIAKTVARGYPITCATCHHFYAAQAAGSDFCGKECGGPYIGRDFPEYKGQLPRTKFASICLMCGTDKIAYHIVVPGKEQRFGVCAEHANTFAGVFDNPACTLPQNTPLLIPLL